MKRLINERWSLLTLMQIRIDLRRNEASVFEVNRRYEEERTSAKKR